MVQCMLYIGKFCLHLLHHPDFGLGDCSNRYGGPHQHADSGKILRQHQDDVAPVLYYSIRTAFLSAAVINSKPLRTRGKFCLLATAESL